MRIVTGQETAVLKAIAAEREACAVVADEYAKRAWAAQYPSQEAAVAAQHIAEAIRARSTSQE